MRRPLARIAAIVAAIAAVSPAAAAAPADSAEAFEQLTGARLVFDRSDLPDGAYFDVLAPLARARRDAAARILVEEARKYPPGYLAAMGLGTVGVFEACVSHRDDGYHTYSERHGGYLYYGVWNGRDALAACYYTDSQLPLTFHHEVFHHVDATRRGDSRKAAHFASDDARFADAIDGRRRYPALRLSRADLAALDAVATGHRLEDAVSDYTSKHPGEDQAETARWLMTHLADGLLQAARAPHLRGSQRVLHLLHEYADSLPDGPDARWFVAVAAGRTPDNAHADLSSRLSSLARHLDADALDDARAALDAAALAAPTLDARTRARLAAAAADLVPALFRARTRASDGDRTFTVWTARDYDGGANHVLQADLARYADDARALDAIAGTAPAAVAARRELARLLDAYEAYIASRWSLSASTAAAFRRARAAVVGVAQAPPRAEPRRAPDNPHLAKVDAAISDPTIRRAIRAVQPATVKIGGGSGVNLAPTGLVLTNAHVADALGKRWTAYFPDGTSFAGRTVAIDAALDLALVALDGADALPIAPIARHRPAVGDFVCAIGHPGTRTPNGEPTGYERWHVSTGTLRGFLPDPLGPQSLGRAKHSAWTYWGHSGSPLFDARGAVAALHNSWDSSTAMRHAVPWEAIRHFLSANDIAFAQR